MLKLVISKEEGYHESCDNRLELETSVRTHFKFNIDLCALFFIVVSSLPFIVRIPEGIEILSLQFNWSYLRIFLPPGHLLILRTSDMSVVY